MSKQHLADMLKSMANGNNDEAKEHFSKYAAEKTQEILARGDAPEGEVTPTPEPVVEPTPEPSEDNKPTDDSTTE